MAVLENQRHERFAQGIASGQSAAQAYVAAGYSPKGAKQSAARLLTNADLLLRIKELQNAVAAVVVVQAGIDKTARLARYRARLEAFQSIIDSRAADPCNQLAAGAKSGYMVRTEKMIGGGDNALKVEEFAVDTPFLREIRELEKQIAIELGEWIEKKEATHEPPGGLNVQVNIRQELIQMGPEFARDYLELCKRHGQQTTVTVRPQE